MGNKAMGGRKRPVMGKNKRLMITAKGRGKASRVCTFRQEEPLLFSEEKFPIFTPK